jgi:hypothetical protein
MAEITAEQAKKHEKVSNWKNHALQRCEYSLRFIEENL